LVFGVGWGVSSKSPARGWGSGPNIAVLTVNPQKIHVYLSWWQERLEGEEGKGEKNEKHHLLTTYSFQGALLCFAYMYAASLNPYYHLKYLLLSLLKQREMECCNFTVNIKNKIKPKFISFR
jgi:hypothetical protein